MRLSLYDFCVQTGREALLDEWNAGKNAPLTPQTVSHGAQKPLYWTCARGHTWQAPPYTRTADKGCPYCAGRRAWPGENDLASCRPDLAAQWDTEKNGGFTPEEAPVGSHRRVWWRCEKGHCWQAAVKTRTGGTGCPICTGRRVAPGENDLTVTHPALTRQWDQEKNRPLTPAAVSAGTNRRVWWRCARGHSWRAAISSRSRGSGCPVCAGKQVVAGENDLAYCHPAIAAQWHPARNGTLTPADCTPSSNRRVWWLCPRGHAYQAAVGARTVNGTGCPYCAGKKVLRGFNDLATVSPLIAASWHPTRNGALKPWDVTAGSARKVWWQCSLGHAWKAVIYSRTGPKKCGCPVCAGKKGSARRAVCGTGPDVAI